MPKFEPFLYLMDNGLHLYQHSLGVLIEKVNIVAWFND